MYATISKEMGVVRAMSWDRSTCEAEKTFQESLGDPCLVVKIPQLMLDDLGARLLEIYKQKEVTE